jgi:hypothetical protein
MHKCQMIPHKPKHLEKFTTKAVKNPGNLNRNEPQQQIRDLIS